MRLVVILSIVFINFNLKAQWISNDSMLNIYPISMPLGGSYNNLYEELSYDYCSLPYDNDSTHYNYYGYSDKADLIYFQKKNSKGAITITGFYRLIFTDNKYRKIVKEPSKGNLSICWVKDLVWTYFFENKITNEFYHLGNLQNPSIIINQYDKAIQDKK